MGLCKCDRKKVTNLFCFEHRVNVCEHCLVSDHPNCIVQSYLTWLQDSDYDASCLFCGKNLCDDTQETVRLLCLHLYHSSCFDAWACQLPPNTAPAGYTCSICYEPVFPKPNQLSPLVDDLKQKLTKFPWAKAGLGLSFASPEYNAGMMNSSDSRPIGKDAQMKMMPDTVLPVDVDTTPNVRKQITTSADLSFLNQQHHPPSSLTNHHNLDTDNPDVKYKRRSAFDFLGRWLKSKNIRRPTVQPWTCKRMFFYMLLVVIGVMTVITVLSRHSHHDGYGSGSHDQNEDLFLDPAANPHIHNVGPEKLPAD